jgi:ATP-binding cassette subfamily C protein
MIFGEVSTLSTGDFVAFNAAYTSFQNALLQMAVALTASLNVVPLYERLEPILQEPPEVDATRTHPGELTGSIEVNHVHFRYTEGGPLVANDVSFTIRPGEFVALVGPSGSGKSTMLRLLLGFETPESGSLYYDGQDLSTLDVREVRRQIGVVLQNARVMPGDVFKNIVGASNLTLDDAWEAARNAGLEEDIRSMPMGMNTMVSAGGETLSGGQRQRLLIARAIVKKPRLLFFDEATSALDNKTQSVVSHCLEGLKSTRVIIAHRLSTVIHADRIIVMEAGRMVESGTYAELMDKNGVFAELAKRQLS